MIREYPLEAGARNNDPRLIVVHAMAEYIPYEGKNLHATEFLEKIGLSAHTLVTPEGDLIRCRPETKGAYHAKGHNKDSLGIEFLVPGAHTYGSFVEAIKGDWVSQVQFATGIWEVARWARKYNITNIQRHSDIDPERKVDPGEGFPWKVLKAGI